MSVGNFGGGGICEGVGVVDVSKSQVIDNHSSGMDSSGIVVALGNVKVTDGSRIDGNVSNGPGGGIVANFGGIVTVSGHSQVDGNNGSKNGGGIVNFIGPHGGVRILGGSEVSHNTLTNDESLGLAVSVFLETLATSLGLDLTTATGGLNAAEVSDDITELGQSVASTSPADTTASGLFGFVAFGDGINTLLGASITLSGGSRITGNHAKVRVGGILNAWQQTLVQTSVLANTPDNITSSN